MFYTFYNGLLKNRERQNLGKELGDAIYGLNCDGFEICEVLVESGMHESKEKRDVVLRAVGDHYNFPAAQLLMVRKMGRRTSYLTAFNPKI